MQRTKALVKPALAAGTRNAADKADRRPSSVERLSSRLQNKSREGLSAEATRRKFIHIFHVREWRHDSRALTERFGKVPCRPTPGFVRIGHHEYAFGGVQFTNQIGPEMRTEERNRRVAPFDQRDPVELSQSVTRLTRLQNRT